MNLEAEPNHEPQKPKLEEELPLSDPLLSEDEAMEQEILMAQTETSVTLLGS